MLSEVSIHTPPRGATSETVRRDTIINVSIHAPRGARRRRNSPLPSRRWFQSTRPRGARRKPTMITRLSTAVSIHAAPRGATFERGVKDTFEDVSIHAPPRGATGTLQPVTTTTYCFNPRAPAGRDLLSASGVATGSCFNPRAPAGRDGEGPSRR